MRRVWAGARLAVGLTCVAVLAVGCTKPVKSAKAVPQERDEEAEDALAAEEGEEPVRPSKGVSVARANGDALSLKGIKLVEDEGQTGVFIKLSRAPEKVEHFTLSDPPRLVIDVYGPVSSSFSGFERPATGDPKVARVRVARQPERLRVTVDLKGPVPKYTLNDLQTMVVAFLGERSGRPSAARSQVLYADTDAGTAGPVVAEPSTATLPSATARAAEESAASRSRVAAANASAGEQKVYTGQRISLDFKDADVLNVLRILAEVSGLNIVATDDVKGRVTVRLVDVPWDQALDIILQANRLDTVRIGNVVRVSTVTRLKEEREAQLAAEEAAKELEPLKVAYIPVNYMKVSGDVNETGEVQGCEGSRRGTQGTGETKLADKLKDVLSDRGKVQVDSRTNTVVVRDIQRGIDDARELITRLDLQTPQVLIESNVVEATDTFSRDLGIQWGYSYAVGPQFGTATGKEFPASVVLGGGPEVGTGAVPGTGPGSPQGAGTSSGPSVGAAGVPAATIPFIASFPATVSPTAGTAFDLALGSIDGSKALNARLTALEEEGKAKILSRPKVVTINNQQAKIEALRIFRVRLPSTGTVISTAPGGVAGSATAATEQIETGIRLCVSPQVSSDGFILLQIEVKSSTADFSQLVDNIPAEQTREAITNVLIRDGETVVLGGVFRNQDSDSERGIPYLRSIPIFGWLFKNTLRDRQREELIVFITPRVVVSGGARISTGLPRAKELWAQAQ